MAEFVECVVVGAGVLGLAVARRLALSGREVIVLEAESAIGTGTSARNSEVIHAGIYYPTGSLKARMCVAGKAALYRFCAERGIAHRRLGKLVVAREDSEIAALEEIRDRAAANGVADLVLLDRDAVARLEPDLRGVAALLSPSSGILDGHAFMLALQGEAEAHGAILALLSPLVAGAATERGFRLRVAVSDAGTHDLDCRFLVNCAGLEAQRVAAALDGFPAACIPPRHLAKGSYFALRGRSPFRRLVYPAPSPGYPGLHLTLDLSGRARFGPDMEWIEKIDYGVDPGRAPAFYAAVRRYWPGLPDGALDPDYAGIRPKIYGPGEPPADFVAQGPDTHGIPGLVNLFGIESPGLTSSLALADHVETLLFA